MGNNQLAIKDFNKSLEIDEKMAEGFFRRGISKLALKNFHEALRDFQES